MIYSISATGHVSIITYVYFAFVLMCRFVYSSFVRRWLCDILALRGGGRRRASGVLRGAPDRGASGPHHRPAGTEELRATAARAPAVVGGPGRVRSLYPVCHPLQPHGSQ